MPHYMLLLHESTTARDLPPDEVQAVIARYVAWSDGLRAKGRLVAGEKLRDAPGRVLRREGERVVVRDGPFAEAKEVLGGFYLIDARDHDEAVELSRSCPHLELGGTIVVREVEDVR
jgi:hypothetical protein